MLGNILFTNYFPLGHSPQTKSLFHVGAEKQQLGDHVRQPKEGAQNQNQDCFERWPVAPGSPKKYANVNVTLKLVSI